MKQKLMFKPALVFCAMLLIMVIFIIGAIAFLVSIEITKVISKTKGERQ